nr:phage tail protein [Aestuariivirga litoralis]
MFRNRFISTTMLACDPISLTASGAVISSLLSTTIIGSVTVGQVALTLALSGASYLLQQSAAAAAGAGVDQGVKQTVQNAIYDERLIYGRVMVGGRMLLYECKPPYLYVLLEIASHEIDAIEQIQINGQVVTFDGSGAANSSNFVSASTPYVYMSARLGAPGQVIDPLLDADFPELASTWRQQGHACVAFKCYYGSSADDHNKFWGSGGFPQFLMLVRGMKCFDPRDATQSSADPTTWKWTNNASLCTAHFLNSDDGQKVDWSEINLERLAAAANQDDNGISLASGGVEKRYTVNGTVNPNASPGEVLQNLLTANLGDLVWSNGVYSPYSGVARDAVWTLNDDSARGTMDVRVTQSRASLLNLVRTVFVASDRDYQTVNGPVIEDITYAAADGESHELTLTLPFTSSATMAQRIAKATMEKSRAGRQITRRESIDALRLEATDVVNFEMGLLPALGCTARVNRLLLDMEKFEFEIDAEEYDSAAFDWSIADEQPFTISPATLSGVN